jgi:peptidoglycan LD-endopeptidase LytH
VLAVVAYSLAFPSAAAAQKAGSMSGAQRAANSAASRYASAKTALADAERRTTQLEAKARQTEAQIGGLEGRVRELTVRQYVNSGSEIAWLEAEDMTKAARTQAMVRFVRIGATDEVDRFRALSEDLTVQRAELAEAVAARRAAAARLKAEEAAARKELARLEEVQRKAEQAKRAEAARRAAAAGRSSRQNPAGARTPAPPRAGSAPRVIGSGSWVCPVQGPRSFTNDWGQPRSGGRRHQGTDILSPRGTPVVASVAGTVRHHNSRLGGLSYYLKGDDGNTYFGTHLASYGASGRVSAGTVVGTIGNSGNASGGPPHLHFEIHPGGGGPTNPYPTLRANC